MRALLPHCFCCVGCEGLKQSMCQPSSMELTRVYVVDAITAISRRRRTRCRLLDRQAQDSNVQLVTVELCFSLNGTVALPSRSLASQPGSAYDAAIPRHKREICAYVSHGNVYSRAPDRSILSLARKQPPRKRKTQAVAERPFVGEADPSRCSRTKSLSINTTVLRHLSFRSFISSV